FRSDAPAQPPATSAAPFSAAVRRQSVRDRVSGQPAQPLNPPGTPPPARPVGPSRPPSAQPTAGAEGSQLVPPVLPPSTASRPAGPGGPTPPPHLLGGTYVPADAVRPARPPTPFEQVARPVPRSKHKTFNATPFVLVLVLGGLLFGAYAAYRSLVGPPSPPSARPSPTVEASPTDTAASPTDTETTPEETETTEE